MKHFYLFALLFLLPISQLNAQYYWQVESITSIAGGGTFAENSTPDDILLTIHQCPGGNTQPHNLTQYTLKWFRNTVDANSGGTEESSIDRSTTAVFDPTINYTPSTSTVGTFYYYAEFSNPSLTTCGFTNTLTSPTRQVIITSTVGISESQSTFGNVKLYPNPTKNKVQVSGLTDSQSYILYDLIGQKVGNGIIANNESVDVGELTKGTYLLKLENGISSRIIKD